MSAARRYSPVAFFAFLLCCLTLPTLAATRLVPSQYITIQAAINASSSGDAVSVAAGTYTGAGNVNLDFGGRNISLIGAGQGVTIIDCENVNGQRGFYFHSGETSAASVQRLTVANGSIISNTAPFGGGALIASGSPQFSHVTFSGNAVSGGGFGSNTPLGGGAQVLGGSPTFSGCSFTGNTAPLGGGVEVQGGSASFLDCVFTGNGYGAAFINPSGSAAFTHCTITDNSNVGIVYNGGSGSVTNCIVYGNGGSGIQNFGSVTATYSDIQGGFSGTGNISADPLFVNGSADLHLQSGSPAIGAGTASGGPTTDYDGRAFLNPPAMGAFEKTITRFVPSQYATIQAAINASFSGDTVQVTTGTYTGNGNTDLDFGGRNITLRGAGASSTVIDCQGGAAGNRRGFYFHNGETAAAVVQGFTVTNGYESFPGGNALGGAAFLSTTSSPTFRACFFTNNQATGANALGGAVTLSQGGPNPTFINCVFAGNKAVATNQTRGGALYAEDAASVTLINCTFFGNSVSGGSTGNFGGALCDIASGALTITNGILYGDTGSPNGEMVVQNATETTTYSDIQGGRTGTGNFSANPQFINGGNYRLTAASPCIDAGTDSGAPTTDLDGNARDAEPDLGAYEFNGHAQLTLTGQNNTAPAQQSFTGTVATLTDANPNAAASDFTASINWGDSTTTAGTVTGGSQPFAVSGTHTYTTRGVYTVTVTVTEKTVGTQKQTTSTFTAVGAPTANAQTVSVGFNTATPITLTGSDPNSPPRSLTYTVVTAPAHGTLTGTAPNLTYTPTAGYHGTDSFTFTVNNGYVTSNTATVTLNVATGTPTANPQSVSVAHDTAKAITLTGSDPDVPALTLTYAIGTGPAHGTLTGTAPNVTYTPSAGYQGSDSFTFTVSNGTNTSSPATVSITVAPGTPTANPQSVSVPFNTATPITLTGSDPDNPPLSLTYTVTSSPTHGTLSGTAPNLTYTPNTGYVGPDSFQFTVSNGTNTSSPATVSISVSLAGTTTTLTSSQNPSVFGQSVTFTATVTGPGGTPATEGSVDFMDTTTSTDLGTVAVNAATGQAAVSISSLSVGSHTIIATYSDSAGIYGGSSDSLAQIVNKADTTTTLTLPSGSVDDSQTFQVSATVAATSPGAGTPTGTVTFTVNGVTQDATLSGGTASITVGPFAPGAVTISASYGGDTSFNASSAGQQSQTVTAGTATHFSVSAPGTATAGTAFDVTVTALDAQGYTATGYTGTVHFTSTDGAATLPADTTLTNGVGTVSVTLNTSGSQTVTATDTVTSAITGTSGSIQVSAGTATHFTVSAPGTATAGTGFNVTVTALDAQGNVATGYTGTVHFTSTDGAASLPTDYTFTAGDGGTHQFSVTLDTAGSQTVTATDTVTSSITGTSGSITVGAAAVSRFSVSAPATATAGTGFTVTVTAKDAFGNTVTGYTGTVHFTSTDGAATLPADATLTGGTGTFSVTLNSGGSQTVTVTDTVISAITGTSGPIQVTGLNPVPHLSTVTLSYAFLGSHTQTVLVTGTGFLPTSVVHWNGTALTTTYVDSTHLSAQIPDALLTSQAAAPVTVVNPAPGGGTSNTVIYTVKVRIASLHLSKGKVKGGTTITATVTLMLPAPPNGQNIGVSCDDPAHVLLPSAKPNVKGGQTSVTFTIKTTKVTSQKTVTITAVAGGTKHQTVILTP